MIDAAGDLAAILDDCGGPAQTVNGELVGRFVEEPVESATSSGHVVLSAEPVYYAARPDIEKLSLVKGAWLDVDGKRWYVKEIPRAETAGLVRIGLNK